MNELIRAILPGTTLPSRGLPVPASLPSSLQHNLISIPPGRNTGGRLTRCRPMIEVVV
jgi:hypothetical protein